jgi:hypothetical protein
MELGYVEVHTVLTTKTASLGQSLSSDPNGSTGTNFPITFFFALFYDFEYVYARLGRI